MHFDFVALSRGSSTYYNSSALLSVANILTYQSRAEGMQRCPDRYREIDEAEDKSPICGFSGCSKLPGLR
jgi:ferredoxin-thioredoxin reductase catalytic subunit